MNWKYFPHGNENEEKGSHFIKMLECCENFLGRERTHPYTFQSMHDNNNLLISWMPQQIDLHINVCGKNLKFNIPLLDFGWGLIYRRA